MITTQVPPGVRTQSAAARPTALLALAGCGAAAVAIALAAPLLQLGGFVHLGAAARTLLLASAVGVVLATTLAPHTLRRRELAAAGVGALGGQALLMAVADPLAVCALLLLLGFAVALRPSARPFVERARGPAFAAVLIGAGWTLAQTPGPAWLARAGALCVALGIAAAAGLLPYLAALDVAEPASSSYVAWTAFFGPALALSLPAKVLPAMPAAGGVTFGAALVGLGLLNLAWGAVGAWRATSDMDAWRCSFLADWGLALTGGGLFLPAGVAAALLGLVSIVAVRLPLYLWARPALLERQPASLGPFNVLLAVLLAGAAPFSGFPVRLLVLRAATQDAWPLAIPLVLAMIVGLASAVRLARTIGDHRGRAAAGLWALLALSLLLGLAPGLVRALAGV